MAKREKSGQASLEVSVSANYSEADKASRAFKSKYDKLFKEAKVDLINIAKVSNNAVGQINTLAGATKQFSGKLSKGAQEYAVEMEILGEELEKAHKKASKFTADIKKAKTEKGKEEAVAKFQKASATIKDLTKQINKTKDTHKKEQKEIIKTVRNQANARKTLEGLADKDFSKGIGKGLLSGIKDAITGKMAKGALAKAGDTGAVSKSMVGMMKAVTAISKIASAIGSLFDIVKKAAGFQQELNKQLLDGIGTIGDFTTNTGVYRGALDELREVVVATGGELNMLGYDAGKRAEIINKFMVASTGSIMKTVDAFGELGYSLGGGVKEGAEEFIKNAISYGKALSMEATDVATMMGNFVSDLGYSATSVQDAMTAIVKSAAGANMTTTKFMDIFNRVIPDVELYQNRLEELTGTIKLLSKTMSKKDVENFMDAFARGFKGVDFKQRLKTALIVGPEKINKILTKENEAKAANLASAAGIGSEYSEKFMKAIKSGTKQTAAFLADYQKQTGQILTGTQQSDIMKLAGYQQAQKGGGALGTATAMSGAGMGATYKIMKELSQSFGTGFDGLQEHVIKQLGVSDQQYEALKTMDQSMEVWKAQLQESGYTTSKSINDNLIALGVTDLKTATEDQLMQAASMKAEKDAQAATRDTAKGLAYQQIDAQRSILDKIENVIGYMLEQIFDILSVIVNVISEVIDTIIGAISGIIDFFSKYDGKTERETLKLWEKESAKSANYDKGQKAKLSEIYRVAKETATGTNDLSEAGEGSRRVSGTLLKATENVVSTLSEEERKNININNIDEFVNKWTSSSEIDREVIMKPENIKAWGERLGIAAQEGQELSITDITDTITKQLAEAVRSGDTAAAGKAMAVLEDIRAAGGVGTSGSLMAAALGERLVMGNVAVKGSSETAGYRGKYSLKGRKPGTSEPLTEEQRAGLEASDVDVRYFDAASAPPAFTAFGHLAGISLPGAGAAGAAPAPPAAPAPTPAVPGKSFIDRFKSVVGAPAGAPTTDQGMEATYKMLKDVEGQFKVGAGGLQPEVLEKLGISTEEYEAYKNSEVTAETTENTAKASESTAETIESVDVTLSKMLKHIKKGSEFLIGDAFKTAIKDSTLTAFRTALLEFAIIEAKMQDEEFAGALVAGAAGLAGKQLTDITTATTEELGQYASAPSQQTGGKVLNTGYYYLHKNEAVLDSMTYGQVQRELRGGGGAGGNNVTVVVNAAPNMTPQQFQNAVEGALSNAMRRP